MRRDNLDTDTSMQEEFHVKAGVMLAPARKYEKLGGRPGPDRSSLSTARRSMAPLTS